MTALGVVAAAVAAVAGGAALGRARQRAARRRWMWLVVAFGAFAGAAGAGLRAWLGTGEPGPLPFPSLPDAAHLAVSPLVAAGLLITPATRRPSAHRVRSLIDGLTVATALLLVSWIVVIAPLLAGGDPAAGLPVALAYPVGDIVLVTVACSTIAQQRRGGRDSRALVLIGAATMVIATADSGYAYLTLHGHRAAGGLLHLGGVAGFGLIILAARWTDRPDRIRTGFRHQERIALLLPYVAVVGALVVSMTWTAEGVGTDPFTYWCGSVLIVLIVGRQLLTLLENRHLTRHLEARVATRTAELYASEQRFRALVQQSSDSVTVIDPDSTIRYQGESVERIFGWSPAVLLGRRLTRIAGHRAGRRIAAAIQSVLREPYASTVVEVPLRHADGRLRVAEMTMTNLLDDPSVGGIVLNTRDVHDARELQDQLVHEAYHDGLTGLVSRTLFGEKLARALAAGRPGDVAVLFLDLDGFKEVNDSLGHAAGDQLLVRAAARLRESVRDGDTVARLGGDEFAVLVESVVAMADAQTLAHRIIAALGEPYRIGGRELHVGVSVGIASAGDAGDLEQLQRNADLAMYRAKAAGGSRLACYDPQMHGELMARLELEADLRLALDRGELTLHYQPTVDLTTGGIAGFEALVRWRHPIRGIVPPLDFIGVAEATGLIVPLGRWVLTEACRQAVAWGAGSTRRLKMAVNVSVRQFGHGDLAATVAEVLAATGMPADQLCLEMTESVLLCDTAENLTQVQRLKALGVVLAMDDFGTGYSSLAYLRRFPMDVLKIDRSFVDRLGGDRADVALVRTIVRLGTSLGMATVAEGIENTGQMAALRDMGCAYGQGYWLSEPLPAADAGRALAADPSIHGMALRFVPG